MPIPFLRPKPRPPAMFEGQPLPGPTANPLSKAVFWWISPILKVGYSRPLQAEDLWTLTDDLLCQTQADRIEAIFQKRLPPSRRHLAAHTGLETAEEGKIRSESGRTSVTKGETDTPLDEKKLKLEGDDGDSIASGSARDSPSDEARVQQERAHLETNDRARQREEGAVMEIAAGMLPSVGANGLLPDGEALALPSIGVAGERTAVGSSEVPSTPVDGEKEKTVLLADTPVVPTAVSKEGAAVAGDVKGKGKGKGDGKGKDADLDPALVKAYGKSKARKIQAGRYAVEDGQVYDQSLVRALYLANWFIWWKSFAYVLAGAALQVTAPLITRQIIAQMTLAYEHHRDPSLPAARSVGYGIGLAVALFVMEEAGSICNYQGQQRGAVMGFLMRSGLIDLISRKSMKLSGKSRIEMTNGRMTTMVSADCSFLDFAGPMTVTCAVEPLQIIVGIALLIYTLGYSALVGLAVLVLAVPFQSAMFVRMITYRQAQMKVVDTRVRLLTEIINNIRAVKLYAYENLFGEKVSALRRKELAKLRRNGLNRSFMISTMNFVPVLATVLTFITYALSGHPLNAATIFSGLQYFNVLRAPITFLPMALTACTDAAVAVGRIGVLLRSEELDHEIHINPSLPHSISAHGSFQFDSVSPPDTSTAGGKGKGGRGGGAGSGVPDRAEKREQAKRATAEKKAAKERKKQGLPPLEKKEEKEEEGIPFALRDVHLDIPRGSLVCVVGRVGTGKTALLSGLINEMKQIEGRVEFGGKVGYVPQQAWVQSGTIQDNITFGTAEERVDLRRMNEVIDACALRTEMNMWADGDQTKIGEKGITLSGGQRQRICLARAAYDDSSEVILLDDPLSAVDAHVGHHLLHRCILTGPLAHRTRILVTHHLDVLPRADMVLVMDRDASGDGRIIQQGTFAELRAQPGVFRSLMEEFGADHQEEEGEEKVKEKDEGEVKKGEGGGKLLLDEEREIGAVSWRVYKKYGQAMGGLPWLLPIALFLCCNQAAQVGNNLMLGYWSGQTIPGFSEGGYMGSYAALGVVVAIFTWLGSYSMIVSCIRASFRMFDGAWKAVMRSPTGWHDRTPTGRIISRLSKDIEMLDDRISMMLNQLFNSALSVVGTFALVVYTFPWLGLIFIPLGVAYYAAASYYRATSREVKRIDSISRSMIYTSFGEQLNGLAVIRAFGKQMAFQQKLQASVNYECQAYIVTITIQRWLGIRLDFVSYTLVFLIAVFASVFRTSVSPSRLGVVLTYSLQAASVFGQLVQMFAQVEQEMNNVERVQYYNDLETEAAETLPTDPPLEQWPVAGAIEFRDVKLRYRSTLPLVLKGLTFDIKPGEKIGIIGRTGAGKSSMAQALFRTVELADGTISIDGRDLRKMGLETVRQRLAIIPQDAFLFAGTVRENVDPTGLRTDAELNELIQLIHLSSASPGTNDKFKLDATVLNEGQNFSAGERQLLALIRAVARRCKVVMLDEATSSVDPETDATIQRIIQTELADVTLISIAHRLQTVAYYDRILVLDHGEVAEFDTPLRLFDDPEGHFRSLCETKGLGRADLVRIQEDAARAVQAWQDTRGQHV